MSAFVNPTLSPFATDVAVGLAARQKFVDPRYLYDEIGTALFETMSMLPEYGLARAEERLVKRYSTQLEKLLSESFLVAEIGSGGSRGVRAQLRCSLSPDSQWTVELAKAPSSTKEDWLRRAEKIVARRQGDRPILLTLLGSSAGTLEASTRHTFLKQVRAVLRPGDYFLFAADLVKDVDKMLSAYDDATGVAAAFNKNLLGRINRELGGRFDLHNFEHTASWNSFQHRVELHLVSKKSQEVYVGALGQRFHFHAGETIRTQCAHKFSELELEALSKSAGFRPVKTWIDIEWAFAEVLWAV